MKIETIIKTDTSQVIDYYNECWVSRFQNGHNPLSLAMHMGYFDKEDEDNDLAKLNANRFLTHYAALPTNKKFTIADLGCGIGGTCLYVASQYSQAEITGVNISEKQAELAAEIAKQRNLNHQINYQVADYSNTNLPAANFDFVIAIESLCHAGNKALVYEEAYRILKPGGTFVFMDYFEINEPANTLQEELLFDFRRGWAVESYIRNYGEELTFAGFTNVTTSSITDKVLPGINQSYQKASHKLSKDSELNNQTYQLHLKACIALQKLVDSNLIEYKIVRATKPV